MKTVTASPAAGAYNLLKVDEALAPGQTYLVKLPFELNGEHVIVVVQTGAAAKIPTDLLGDLGQGGGPPVAIQRTDR